MISLETVTNFIYEYCENVRPSKGGLHFLARCPICGDSKKSKSKRRFNFEYSDENGGVYHCFNCGSSGSFINLYAMLKGINPKEAFKELNTFNSKSIIERVTKPTKKTKIKENNNIEYHDYILNDCISHTEKVDGYLKSQYQNKLISYMKSRKIDSDVFISYKGDYQSRYIIPIYDSDGHIIYFQARRIDESMQPKYKNPDTAKITIIYNKHKFKRDKHIIVTEGLLDSKSIGNQGTSCLGKEISNNFIKELSTLTDVGIIIALDNDKDGMLSILKVIENKEITFNMKFFLFPYKYKMYKDLNQFTVSENINSRDAYEFVVKNSYTKVNTYTKIKAVKWRANILLRGEEK